MTEDVFRPRARLPRGLGDLRDGEFRARSAMLERLADTCASWGFVALDTPLLEYADALGKFLPDEERPNAGVFALTDDDEQWLALRYDLTAPLARHVATHYDELPKPFRRYQYGAVFRNEKPDAGRFRQFWQFDADVVGAPAPFADAELFALAAACLDALGLQGAYALRLSNRKLLDGLLESLGIAPTSGSAATRRLAILRAIDKLDRLGLNAVAELLGAGRKDASGDFTPGAQLPPDAVERVLAFVRSGAQGDNEAILGRLQDLLRDSAIGCQGVEELHAVEALMGNFGVGEECVRMDPSIVRGLEYYTGPIFEIELGGKDARLARFGSIGGGGRYDDLVARFKGVVVPATGFSIGISRLQAGLQVINEKVSSSSERLQLVILMPSSADRSAAASMARMLRQAGVCAEVYLGSGGMRAQMRYADRRNAKIAVIQGEQERARGEVTLRNLVLGKRLSADMKDASAWKEGGAAQIRIPERDLLQRIREMLLAIGDSSP